MNSAAVVKLLCGINEREVVAGIEQTAWQAEMTEWMDVPTNSNDVALNFFPVEWGWVEMADAFTQVAFTNWTYTVTNKTISLTDPPSCLLVNYIGSLGGKDAFTNAYDNESVVIPALTTNTLAGIPITTGLVSQVQAAATNLISHYLDRTRLTNGTFNGYFAANTNATAFPALTVTGLLARLNLTTNGFDWTPWNSQGTAGVYDILTNMTLTSRTGSWTNNGEINWVDGSAYAAPLSSAEANAIANATPIGPHAGAPEGWAWWYPSGSSYMAEVHGWYSYILVTNLCTNYSAAVDAYCDVSAYADYFNSGSLGYVESDNPRRQKSGDVYDGSGTLRTGKLGSTNSFPEFIAPAYYYAGYELGNTPKLLFDWSANSGSATNGFKYP